MKALVTILMFICLCCVNTVQADYITITPAEYQELEIPVCMLGPIWVEFDYEGFHYTAIHVFANYYDTLSVLLVQRDDMDKRHLIKLTHEFCLWWNIDVADATYSPLNNGYTIVDMPKSSIELTSRMLHLLKFNIADAYQRFDDVLIHISLPDDMSECMKKCIPAEVLPGSLKD
jgi:hypothetical protein